MTTALSLIKSALLFDRMKCILGLLDIFGGSLTRIELQKLLFLFTTKGQGEKKYYDFVPYKYGCYSFQSAKDIDYLTSKNLITASGNGINDYLCLNPLLLNYSMIYPQKLEAKLKAFFNTPAIKDLRGEALVKYVYDNYPKYTINSERKDLLSEAGRQRVLEFRQGLQTKPQFFTIGYEGKSIDYYLMQLIENNIKVLCDVRKNPFSQKFGFSKCYLINYCDKLHIRYLHIPELGIESDKRSNLKTLQDYEFLFDNYERTTLKDQISQVKKLTRRVEDFGDRLAITCFEADVKYCHRGRIAKRYEQMTQHEVIHL